MAILGKIRSKGVLLLVVIGFALFAFIIGDALTQGSSYLNKSREVVAVIEGEKVDIKEYSELIEQLTEVYKIEYGQNELSEEVTNQIRGSVWETLVSERLIHNQAEKLGLSVSSEELSDHLIGNNIHPLIQQRRAFAGKDGRFSRPALVQFLNSLEQTPESAEAREQIAKAKKYWLFWERTVKNSLLQEKYNALFAKAVTANSLEAKLNYDASKTTVDVNYVVQPYFSIQDGTSKVDKSEIKALYEKRKELFKQEDNRAVNYVVFSVKPSAEDYKKAQTAMKTLSEEFKTTADPIAFVNENSDVHYNNSGYTVATVPANLKDFAFSAASGAITGPAFANDTYTMARLIDNNVSQSDSVKLRHIFLAKQDEGKTDSIIAAIKGGAVFAELAQKFSAVKETAANGGEIGWIVRDVPGLDKDLSDKAFAGGVNEVFTIKNDQGTQIMQVTDKSPARRKAKLAILEIKVTTSNLTVSHIYNQAKQFAAELTGDKFSKKAEEKGYVVRTANDLLKSTEKIADLGNSRQVVRWTFENEKGDVSDVYDCNNQFVVATITEVNEKGYRPVEKVADQLKAEIIRDKKAEQMIKALTPITSKALSLEEVAASINGEVKSAPGVNFSAYQFGAAGFEPGVIGKVSVSAVNKVSAPVKGNSGVYVLLPTNPQVSPAPYDAKMQIMQLNSRLSYALPYMILQNLRDKADIVDNRINFF
jgi:peptidyl-prolyl cis-trans isomerase D